MSEKILNVHVIGAGLAGSEAAWQLAQRGIRVTLLEMRPLRSGPAHRTRMCAELVCSNSLRGGDPERNAVGLLHEEMRHMGSLVLAAADAHRVPAGGALAVDRERFSSFIQQKIEHHPLITLTTRECHEPPADTPCIIATGPLTSDALIPWMEHALGQGRLFFFDALAPIIAADSIDMDRVWKQSRYDKGGDDYINCPMDRETYQRFVDQLLTARTARLHDFELDTPFFEGCLPIEVMAARGLDTLRFGPMKPVGLANPREGGGQPWAVVQLRQDNDAATLWNMVGFQTRMTWPEQQRVFRMIPGLEQAQFERLGAMHRNTYIQSPLLLDQSLRLRTRNDLFFAGQITGVEGYVESAASGLLAGMFMAGQLLTGQPPSPPPVTTALGALLHHVTQSAGKKFEPMNINFGLFPPLKDKASKKQRKAELTRRARVDLASWIGSFVTTP
ncbi:MAG: methylenetetrahydrofolate--tRNA-(uracil(54)-C(5))-methyltransferase (FADH(2)-oxidizing) TrmFO [Magnetococcales bacterium]|nr:methylenetetrahydrofolate--tRNA-(uracil(54)-C(5))-methyltransferase (FADH(2)-oxidizing) TrmFO [Magnetococcales bacterium]MBF0151153.1 methylenetetrahydrofolate--tRNA-(uracil(54)-C(5))-methyltransferase (FADH(2)-oxidizing) TrmFO [Magnetococcales bacterium]MBF0347059.1 methylenetetrahydrofolate--tRNA-(uracil(54)-C(5))-methyltransferase (FADH(2)-oxidizing) TrmFO [Magnetococcales bacterium]MBF0629986.1 methylenetetrahydrofolate--tRNA-(uracil(54)-C(5))-methyltransferase (FADH(2)-oxidizing) TrmFO [